MVHAAVRLRGRLQGVRGVCRVAGDEGLELGAGSLHLKRPCPLAPENQSWTIGYDGHLALLESQAEVNKNQQLGSHDETQDEPRCSSIKR